MAVRRDPDEYDSPPPDTGLDDPALYALEGEENGPYVRPRGTVEADTPWRALPAKRVQTTLGRPRPRGADVPPPDANARLVDALRPGSMRDGAAVVRAVDPSAGVVRADRPRPAPMRYLRPLIVREDAGRRWLFAAIANFFTLGFLAQLLVFWAPAGAGLDQNGYLLGGRLLAEQGTMRFVPDDPFAFVGDEWVAVAETTQNHFGQEVLTYVPRYPAGLPAIYALVLRAVPNQAMAIDLVYLVSPICAALSVLGMFYLGRFAGGSFLGALAMLALAGTQVLLLLANEPNSHAPTLAFVVWGFVALLSWWRTGGILRGLLGGLLLGYAFTIRYTEGLLLLPLALACLFAFEWKRPFSSGWRVVVPIIGWLCPVIGLLVYNHTTTGTLTGYAPTGLEAGAFTLANLQGNWEVMARQFNDTGLYFLLPLGVMGLLAMLARRLGIGLVMIAWGVGTVLLYTAYQPTPAGWDEEGVGYLRFFLTAFPPVLFGMAYLLRRVLNAPSDSAPQRVEMLESDGTYRGREVQVIRDPQRGPAAAWRNIVGPMAAGLVVAVAVGIGSHRAAGALPGTVGASVREPGLQANFTQAANTAVLGKLVRQLVPEGSVVFMDAPGSAEPVLHHVQYAGNYELYEATIFSNRFARSIRSAGNGQADHPPDPLQEQRYAYLQALYEDKTDADLAAEVRRIVHRALDEGREVYLVMKASDKRRFRQAHLAGHFNSDSVEVSYDELRPVYPLDALAIPGQRDGISLMRSLMPRSAADVNQWQIVRVTAARRG